MFVVAFILLTCRTHSKALSGALAGWQVECSNTGLAETAVVCAGRGERSWLTSELCERLISHTNKISMTLYWWLMKVVTWVYCTIMMLYVLQSPNKCIKRNCLSWCTYLKKHREVALSENFLSCKEKNSPVERWNVLRRSISQKNEAHILTERKSPELCGSP